MNRRDRILIGGLLILALAVSGLLFLLRKNGAWAVVRVGGTEGKVRYNGQTITCLPNQLTVTISGGEKNDVDLAAS